MAQARTFSISDELWGAVTEQATKEGRPRSNIICDSIELYLSLDGVKQADAWLNMGLTMIERNLEQWRRKERRSEVKENEREVQHVG